jgi:hypothetical protein
MEKRVVLTRKRSVLIETNFPQNTANQFSSLRDKHISQRCIGDTLSSQYCVDVGGADIKRMEGAKCSKLEGALAVWRGKLKTVQQQTRAKVIGKRRTLLLFYVFFYYFLIFVINISFI